MPPEYITAYSAVRAYTIKVDEVLWDQENSIAVRVFDGGGGGGIVEGPISLSVIGMDELVSIKPVMEREDHLFLDEGAVNLTIIVKNELKGALTGEMTLVASTDFGEEIKTLSYPLKVRSGKSKRFPWNWENLILVSTIYQPVLKSDMDNKRYDFAIGVRPEEIVSPLDRADDFENYWYQGPKGAGCCVAPVQTDQTGGFLY